MHLACHSSSWDGFGLGTVYAVCNCISGSSCENINVVKNVFIICAQNGKSQLDLFICCEGSGGLVILYVCHNMTMLLTI